jgi:hypothetical protein
VSAEEAEEEVESQSDARLRVKRLRDYAVKKWPNDHKKRLHYYLGFLDDYKDYPTYYSHSIELLDPLVSEERAHVRSQFTQKRRLHTGNYRSC